MGQRGGHSPRDEPYALPPPLPRGCRFANLVYSVDEKNPAGRERGETVFPSLLLPVSTPRDPCTLRE